MFALWFILIAGSPARAQDASEVRAARVSLERAQARWVRYDREHAMLSDTVALGLPAQSVRVAYQSLLREISEQLAEVEALQAAGRTSEARRLFFGRRLDRGRADSTAIEPGWMRTARREVGCDRAAGVFVRIECAERVWRRFGAAARAEVAALGAAGAPAVAACTVSALGPELALASVAAVVTHVGGGEILDRWLRDGPDASLSTPVDTAETADPVDRALSEPADPCSGEADVATCRRRIARRERVSRDREWITRLPFPSARPARLRSWRQLATEAVALRRRALATHRLPAEFASFWLESEARLETPRPTAATLAARQGRWAQAVLAFDSGFDSALEMEDRVAAGVLALREFSLDLENADGTSWGRNLEGGSANDEVQTLMLLAGLSRRARELEAGGYRLAVQVYANRIRPVLVRSDSDLVLDLTTLHPATQAAEGTLFEPAVVLQSWLDRAVRDERISRAPRAEGLLLRIGSPLSTEEATSRSDAASASALLLWPRSAGRWVAPITPAESLAAGSPDVPGLETTEDLARMISEEPEAVRFRTPGPPARVRTLAQLLAVGRSALAADSDANGFPDLALGAFLMELDAADPAPAPGGAAVSQADYDLVRSSWQELLERSREESPLDHRQVMEVVVEEALSNYFRDHSAFTEALLGEGVNCQGETQVIAAAMQALQMPPPPGMQYAVQIFDDHIQFVLFEPATRRVINLLNGETTVGISGALYRPPALLAGALAAHGAPFSAADYEQWLIAAPDAAALAAGTFEDAERDFSSRNVPTGIALVPGIPLPRSGRGAVPATAVIRPWTDRPTTRSAGTTPPREGERRAPAHSAERIRRLRERLGERFSAMSMSALPPSVAAWARARYEGLARARSPRALEILFARFLRDLRRRWEASMTPEEHARMNDPRLIRGSGVLTGAFASDSPTQMRNFFFSSPEINTPSHWFGTASDILGFPAERLASGARAAAVVSAGVGEDPVDVWLRSMARHPEAVMAMLGRMTPTEQAYFWGFATSPFFQGGGSAEQRRWLGSFARFLARASEVGLRPAERAGAPVREGVWIEFTWAGDPAGVAPPPLSPVEEGEAEGVPDRPLRRASGSRVVVSLETLMRALAAVGIAGETAPLRRWTSAMTRSLLESLPSTPEEFAELERIPLNGIARMTGEGPIPGLCGVNYSRGQAEYVYRFVESHLERRMRAGGSTLTVEESRFQVASNLNYFFPDCVGPYGTSPYPDSTFQAFQAMTDALGFPRLLE